MELRELLKTPWSTKETIETALKRVSEVESISLLYDILKNIILSEAEEFESSGATTYEKSLSELAISVDNKEQIRDDLTQWVNDEFSPVDERIEVSRRKKVRRFDSLAQVLSSQQASISVCGAVTIDASTHRSRLIIAANISSNDGESIFLNELRHKLGVLKNFYTDYTYGYKILPPEDKCVTLAFDLYKELFPGHNAFSVLNEPNMLVQAVYKITHALLYDQQTFTDDEKEAFLHMSSSVALLPTKINQSVEMQINYLTPRGLIQTSNPLDHKIKANELKYIHAEQLMALFLFKESNIPRGTRFIFGISKLCCVTCDGFLKSYPEVEFRGHHQKQYHGVINLLVQSIPVLAQAPQSLRKAHLKRP